MVKSSSNRKKSLFKSKNARSKYLSPCLLSFEKRSFPDSTLQATWLGWSSSTAVSQESLPPPDYLCPPEVTNWTAAVWVTLSS